MDQPAQSIQQLREGFRWVHEESLLEWDGRVISQHGDQPRDHILLSGPILGQSILDGALLVVLMNPYHGLPS